MRVPNVEWQRCSKLDAFTQIVRLIRYTTVIKIKSAMIRFPGSALMRPTLRKPLNGQHSATDDPSREIETQHSPVYFAKPIVI